MLGMRVPTILVCAAVGTLTPWLAAADPAQPQPAATAQPATAPATPDAAPAARPAAGEKVVVTGAAEKDDPDDPNRVECRSEPELGSRLMGKRECLTLREWDDRRKKSQAILDGAQSRALLSGYAR
jgi:hypothetical protein